MDERSRPVVIATAASVAVVLVGWLALPYMQDAQRSVDRQASAHVERARRLLHQYDPQLAYAATVREQLRAADVDVDMSQSDFSDSKADTYQAIHGGLWTAFEPKNWESDPPRADRPSYGNINGEARKGATAFGEIARRNTRLLDDALAEVNEALAITVGDASGRGDLQANQLKALIVHQKGIHAHAEAALRRGEAGPLRNALLGMAGEAGLLRGQLNLVADSGIEGAIEELREKLGQTDAGIKEKREQLATVGGTIREMEARLAAAKAQAEQAGAELDKLELEGLSFSDPRGADAFRDRILKINHDYTLALRQAQMIEQGGYPKAEIDVSGDFLRGKYLENGQPDNLTIDKGLKHHRLERDVLASKIAIEQASMQQLEADLSQLERTREEYRAAETGATARLAALAPEAEAIFDELNRAESEAFAIEEKALGFFDEAASALQQAARSGDQWMAVGRERTQNLSPEAQQRSAFQERNDDGWLAGHTLAETAAARLAKAWIHYDRYRGALRDAETLSALNSSLTLAEAGPEGERTKADQAKKQGIDEIKQAMVALEKAHKGLNRHWSVTAQSGGTIYLLALFGETDYVADAIQHYRNALKGREAEPFAEPFATRLAELERLAASEPNP